MKKLFCICLLLLSVESVFAQAVRRRQWKNELIPQPTSVTTGSGFLALPSNLKIYVPKNEEIKNIAEGLASSLLNTANEVQVKEGTTVTAKSIVLSLQTDKTIPKEGYRLKVSSSGISITANEPAGVFYGVQTLLQLLPKQVEENKARKSTTEWLVPVVTIEDQPRFGWRGLMLDVSRHFFTVKEVKEFIDQMVKYKFNMLHLHLTDDQGWRLQIKSLPKLTEVGAWRVERTGTFGTLSKPEPGEAATYGGFYTHEDIKELVKYAADRFVNILPEIDVPGHSLAALAAYPELSCTPGDYYVSPGDRFMVWPGGGQHFYGLIDNTLCPANEKVYDFLDKVFTEVAALFPYPYIHMGGDETARNFWEKTDAIKTLMAKEKLKDLDEVQSYFVKRVNTIINSKGKKMIGWDEILQGGLVPGAAVMSWRGLKGGIAAAKMGHEVVMSPTDFAYLDYMQGDASLEPPVYASLRLKKTYQLDPLPDSVDPKLVKGGQANLWTEQVYNTRHLQYMIWPRAMAISEVLWSAKEKKNWNDFTKRVETHFERLNTAGIKYSPAIYDPIITASKKDTATVIVKLETEIEGLDIHYSFDNSFPDNFYPVYKTALTVPKDAATMRLITYRDNKPMGRMMTITMAELKKGAGIK